jgi:SAM-dependent methyltransferase
MVAALRVKQPHRKRVRFRQRLRGVIMPNARPLGIAQTVVMDRTDTEDYKRLVWEEIEHFSDIPVTDQLTEGGIHAHKSWSYYFQYLYAKHFKMTFYEAVLRALDGKVAPSLLSVGCGYGGHDLAIARQIARPFELFAVDLNPRIYNSASRRAADEGLPIHFRSLDLNRIALEADYFDVIYAVASLHHILNLEHLLLQLHRGLKDDGRLVIVDIIGKTQVEFWPDNVAYAAKVVKRLPARYRGATGKRFWNRLLFDPYTIIAPYVEPVIQQGMEGIRQEEIEPLLGCWFQPEKVFYYDAYLRLICTNAVLGTRIDPEKPEDRALLESLIDEEAAVIAAGKLRPTEVFGIYKKKAA